MTPNRLNNFTRSIRLLTVIYFIALFYGTHRPSLHIDVGIDFPFALDKLLHFGAFGGLCGLLIFCRVTARPILVAFLATAIYLPIDELTQNWMQPNRTFDLYDIVAGWSGVISVTLGWLIIRWLQKPAHSFVDHAKVMSIVTLCSRAFGLVRDWALAFSLGFNWVYDAFVIAFMIPNLFRRLFGEGALSAAFIPHYTKLTQNDKQSAHRFALLVLEILFGGLFLISLLVCLTLVGLIYFGPVLPVRFELMGILTAITIWYMPLVCVLAVISAMLQVHGRFGIPAAAPILLNLLVITAAIGGYYLTGTVDPVSVTFCVAGAVGIVGVVQVIWVKLALKQLDISLEHPPKPRVLLKDETVRQTGKTMMRQWVPTTIGLAVFQMNVLLDSLIAMFFAGQPGQTMQLLGYTIAYPLREGDVAVIGATARLYEFPLGVFGIAIATAIFPALTKAVDDSTKFSQLLRQGLRLAMFIGLPASVGLILIRYPLAKVIYFGEGNMTSDDAARIAAVLIGYASAVWAYSTNHVLTRVFYSKQNPTTPMRVSVGLIGLNLALNLTLIWKLGVAGLAWSTAICAILQCGILIGLSRRYVDSPINRNVLVGWLKTVVLTVVMGGGVWFIIQFVDSRYGLLAMSRLGLVGVLATCVATGGVIIFGGGLLLGMDELKWIRGRESL